MVYNSPTVLPFYIFMVSMAKTVILILIFSTYATVSKSWEKCMYSDYSLLPLGKEMRKRSCFCRSSNRLSLGTQPWSYSIRGKWAMKQEVVGSIPLCSCEFFVDGKRKLNSLKLACYTNQFNVNQPGPSNHIRAS